MYKGQIYYVATRKSNQENWTPVLMTPFHIAASAKFTSLAEDAAPGSTTLFFEMSWGEYYSITQLIQGSSINPRVYILILSITINPNSNLCDWQPIALGDNLDLYMFEEMLEIGNIILVSIDTNTGLIENSECSEERLISRKYDAILLAGERKSIEDMLETCRANTKAASSRWIRIYQWNADVLDTARKNASEEMKLLFQEEKESMENHNDD